MQIRTTFAVLAEGNTGAGALGSTQGTFTNRTALYVEPKLSAVVSAGDRMVLGEAFLKVASGQAVQVLYDAVDGMQIESPALRRV